MQSFMKRTIMLTLALFALWGGARAADDWRVYLESYGTDKSSVISAVREITGLGLKDAKDLVDSCPCYVLTDVSEEVANNAVAKLTTAGATASAGQGDFANQIPDDPQALEPVWRVWLDSYDSSSSSSLIAVLKNGLGISVADATTLMQTAPRYVAEGMTYSEANALAKQMRAAGAEVRIGAGDFIILETPLTFQAYKASSLTIDNPIGLTILYRINGGALTATDEDITIPLAKNDKIELYGDNESYYVRLNYINYYSHIKSAEGCYVYGNVMSLISSSGFKDVKKITGLTEALSELFKESLMENHPTKDLVLPATSLREHCYNSMFMSCTKLTRAPELPATSLGSWCYCSMFSGCTSLKKAPELPATTLTDNCYRFMFRGCTSLETAPVLPAPTLEYLCYESMFEGCTSLNKVVCYAIDISAENCTRNWLNNVSATGTFDKTEGFTGWTSGVNGIPEGWTVTENGLQKTECNISFSVESVTATYSTPFTEPTLTTPDGVKVTYSSSNPDVAEVNGSTGKVTLKKSGTTTITAYFAGNDNYYAASASYTLKVVGKGEQPQLAFAVSGVVAGVGVTKPSPALTISDGLTGKYTSSNNKVAAVDAETGELVTTGVGTAAITVTTGGNMQYAEGSAKYYVMVLEDAPRVRCDANGDGEVTITDAVTVVNQILNGGK